MMFVGWIFINFEKFEPIIKIGVDATQRVALILIPLFLMIEFGIVCVRYLSNKTSTFDLNRFFTYLLIWFFTFQYLSVINSLDFLIETIEIQIRTHVAPEGLNLAKTASDLEGQSGDVIKCAKIIKEKGFAEGQKYAATVKMNYYQLAEAKKLAEKSSQFSLGDVFSSIATGIERLFDIIFNLPVVLLSSLDFVLGLLIRMIVETMACLLIVFLVIVGPLAIAFNMMPFGINEGVMRNWFGTWFSIRCWMITMTLLDFIQVQLHNISLSNILTGSGLDIVNSFEQSFLNGIFSVSIIILYIITPFLTNLYAKGMGGQFLSLAVGAAAMVVKGAAKAAGGGGGGS